MQNHRADAFEEKILIIMFSNSDIILEGIYRRRENIGQSSFVCKNLKTTFKDSFVRC
jgi:hypothetical protein